MSELENSTLRFVEAFKQHYPEVVKEAALFNLATLRSQRCFDTQRHMMGWEELWIVLDLPWILYHVWNYEVAALSYSAIWPKR